MVDNSHKAAKSREGKEREANELSVVRTFLFQSHLARRSLQNFCFEAVRATLKEKI